MLTRQYGEMSYDATKEDTRKSILGRGHDERVYVSAAWAWTCFSAW